MPAAHFDYAFNSTLKDLELQFPKDGNGAASHERLFSATMLVIPDGSSEKTDIPADAQTQNTADHFHQCRGLCLRHKMRFKSETVRRSLDPITIEREIRQGFLGSTTPSAGMHNYNIVFHLPRHIRLWNSCEKRPREKKGLPSTES